MGCLFHRIGFDGIGIHRRNLTLNELEWNLTLNELEWNLTRHLVGKSSIPSLKLRRDEFLKLWDSMEFKGFHQVYSAKQTSLRNLAKKFVISIPSNSFEFCEPSSP